MGNDKAVVEILSLIRHISVCLKRRMMCEATDMGFSISQFIVMYELAKTKSMSMHELQDTCGLPKSTLSRIVEQLVKRSLVARTRPDNNRRVVMLSVTPAYSKEKEKLKQAVSDQVSRGINLTGALALKKSLEDLYRVVKIEE
jgi:DNA-binding MarR family transcriptional regulator